MFEVFWKSSGELQSVDEASGKLMGIMEGPEYARGCGVSVME